MYFFIIFPPLKIPAYAKAQAACTITHGYNKIKPNKIIIVYKCIAVNGTKDSDIGRFIRACNGGLHDRIPAMEVIAFTGDTN